jgi:peptidyl-prolyl cis-trans isomerase B (cyclophilin B)
MAKKRKNANYVTEKTILAKQQKEAALRKAKMKKIMLPVIITAVSVILVLAILLGVGIPCGWYEYKPEATHYVTIEIEGYGEIELELYGNDAPETAKNFVSKASSLEGLTIHKFADGLLYGGSLNADAGDKGIKGEFKANGVKNKISHTKGVISMARGEGFNSASAQFFIATEKSKELNGNYAAFGKVISGMEIIEKIAAAEKNEDGTLKNRPVITKITVETAEAHDEHAGHNH